MLLKLSFIFLIFYNNNNCWAEKEEAFVTTDQGPLSGSISMSRDGHKYFKFLGIPYGRVLQRFQMSRAAEGWGNETRKALEFGPPCLQIDEFTGQVSGSEECLTLNVFSPKLNKSSPLLPVLFVIHPGGFTAGGTENLGASYIMDHNVLMVTANYRLGPFGFLNAGVEGATGNQGLKDLVLALRWTRDNIQQFGGDPLRIVVEGSSSASFASSYMTLSPMSGGGLLSGAISHSGGALCPWTRQFKEGMALKNAKMLGIALDCPSNDATILVKCLQRLDPKVILEATFPADSVLFNVSYPQFGPSLETHFNSDEEIFLKEDPASLLLKGDFNRIPYILGTNSAEGLLTNAAGVLSQDPLILQLNTEWGRVAPNTFLYEEYAKDPCKVSGALKEFYFRGKNISKEEDSYKLSLAYGDRWFFKCSRDMAIPYSRFAPIYLYSLARQGPYSLLDNLGWYLEKETSKPPTHADELRYLFPTHFAPKVERNSSDYVFSKSFINMFTSFAERGKPSCGSSCNWSGMSKDGKFGWLEINETFKMVVENEDFVKRIDFWDSLELQEFDWGLDENSSTTLSSTLSPLTTFLNSSNAQTSMNFSTFAPALTIISSTFSPSTSLSNLNAETSTTFSSTLSPSATFFNSSSAQNSLTFSSTTISPYLNLSSAIISSTLSPSTSLNTSNAETSTTFSSNLLSSTTLSSTTYPSTFSAFQSTLEPEITTEGKGRSDLLTSDIITTTEEAPGSSTDNYEKPNKPQKNTSVITNHPRPQLRFNIFLSIVFPKLNNTIATFSQ